MGELATLPALVVLVPLLGAVAALFVASLDAASWLAIAASTLSFACACALPFQQDAGSIFSVDPLAAHMALLTGFVGMTTAWFSRFHARVEARAGRLARIGRYHALLLALLGCLLLALLAANIAIAWIGLAAAMLALTGAVALPGTDVAMAAAWKMLLLCGVGLLLALFGSLLLAAGTAGAMTWHALADAAPKSHAATLNLGFALLLVGYGSIAALAPLHAWFADAQAAGALPIAAVLGGSLPNVALIGILRARGIVALNTEAMAPGPALMLLGIASLLIGGIGVWRRRDVMRVFAASGIAQAGIAAFAFGLGGGAAIFAGLLQLTLHTLGKTAVLHCIGRIAQFKGQDVGAIGGLIAGHRALALTLAAAILAVAMVPPFGLFTSAFLIAMETARRLPWLAVPLGVGLTILACGLGAKLVALCLGEPTPDHGPAPVPGALLPAWLHLAVVLLFGVAMPGAVVAWLATVAESLP